MDYKRPTFDITFDKQQGSYQLGDKVEVKGKIQSYSGVLLQDLPVKVYSEAFCCRSLETGGKYADCFR